MAPRSCEPYSALHHSRARARALGTEKRGLSRHKRPPPRSLEGSDRVPSNYSTTRVFPFLALPLAKLRAVRCRIEAPLWRPYRRRRPSMIIGKLENQANGRITGKLDALLVGCIPLTFEPNSKGADYTVQTETGCEVGAAWKKTSKDGSKTFISVRLDSPVLTKP